MLNPPHETFYALRLIFPVGKTWHCGICSKLSGSALTGQNVLKAADLITSNLMRQLSGTLGLEEKDLA
jgi:hypothetical protein